MGPHLLFDKSFIQSVGLNSSVWLDRFFTTIICPVFYSETLADLEKNMKNGKSPEIEVQVIARKTPEMGSEPCAFHYDMVISSLFGDSIPMNGIIPKSGGNAYRNGKNVSVKFEVAPEAEAFSRWQAGEFDLLERKYAKAWRLMINNVNFDDALLKIQNYGIDWDNIKTLEQVKAYSKALVETRDRFLDRAFLFLLLLGVNDVSLKKRIIDRWSNLGERSLRDFAPYAAFVAELEIFFHVAAKKGFISFNRATNKIDLAYLYYLPFCIVFVSSDKLHRTCAKYFLRNDQEFIWGEDLKKDLDAINAYYQALPTDELEKGVYKFAKKPPLGKDSIVTRLWDKYCFKGENVSKAETPPENVKDMLERIGQISDLPMIPNFKMDNNKDEVKEMVVERMIHKKKGIWYLLPESLKDPSSNNKG